MGKSGNYLHEDEVELLASDDFDSGDSPEPETRRREKLQPPRHGARQRLDSRKDELWLKQQLNDWGDEFDDAEKRAD
jgi:hypothetical protein